MSLKNSVLSATVYFKVSLLVTKYCKDKCKVDSWSYQGHFMFNGKAHKIMNLCLKTMFF